MDHEQDSDAQILWEDALRLLAERNMSPATLAMLRSCKAISFEEDTLHVGCAMAFAQRKIMEQTALVEECLEQAAFQPVTFVVDLVSTPQAKPMDTSAVLSEHEISELDGRITSRSSQPSTSSAHAAPQTASPAAPAPVRREEIPISDAKLTFDRFVEGEENQFALEAAKQVANGENMSYNPLFIYGKSGLGKTHLLCAIRNYIAQNDPSRYCVYRTSTEFRDEFSMAMASDRTTAARNDLARRYQDVDVLIIDDIQNIRSAGGTIRFFFDTFNLLLQHGKQIVLAADRTPKQLAMGDSKFDERDTSRMDSGVTVAIQVPDYELKLNLINTFYERQKEDAAAEHVSNMSATISEDMRKFMAERAGTNIRTIASFVTACLLMAYRREQDGHELTEEDITRIAGTKWQTGQKIVTVDQIQKAVEGYYGIARADLIGSKRNKELMEPRHVAIWLARTLTEDTLADIGKRFGGRSHATVKHSLAWVEEHAREDRLLYERISTIKDEITDKAGM